MAAESETRRTIWVAIIGATATIIAALLSYMAVTRAHNDSSLSYTGFVHNAARQPITGAKVSITEDESIPELHRTDSEGIFYARLSKKTQRIRIAIEADGYEPYTLNGQPARSGLQDIELKGVSANTQHSAVDKPPHTQAAPRPGGQHFTARNAVQQNTSDKSEHANTQSANAATPVASRSMQRLVRS